MSISFACEVNRVAKRHVERRADALADAAGRWRDADFAPRVRATRGIIERTGYTQPVVDYALDRLFGAIGRDVVLATIEQELGSLDALERFVPRDARPAVMYRGDLRVAIVSSDTTIGVAIPSLVFALCAGANVVVKDREDHLVASFVETLRTEDPELAARVRTATWRGADDSATRAQLGEAQTVVAFGRDESLAAIRAMLAPATRFVAFAHRTSIGYVTRETLGDETAAKTAARGAALDALLYDGDGCLSLHALFVERGALLEPAAFGALVAQACDTVEIEFPPSRERSVATTAYRRAAHFRAAQGEGAALGTGSGRYLLVLDPPRSEPPPFLPRTLALYAVDGPQEMLAFVLHHALPLEAVAVSEERADIREAAIASSASRLAPLGALQAPPLGGEHGGVERILPFVRAIYRA